ncbi:MAG TPA: hypothetical protein VMI09_04335 [Candidatus Binataceae bacterium]|nr:hypothetical protein [Candidatus Binataceae bacterium]
MPDADSAEALICAGAVPKPDPATVSSVFQPVVTNLVIPIALLLIAALGNKVSRTAPGWLLTDFYLGPDLCLAAVSTGLFKIFDLLKRMPIPQEKTANFVNDVASCAVLVIFTFGMYIYSLVEHRECLDANPPGRFALFRLGFVCIYWD